MQTRELPIEEWDRLKALPGLPMPLETLTPEHCATAVVEQEGQIVACAVAMTLVHGDLWWIHPFHRKNPTVVAALLTQFFEMVASRGLSTVFITAPSPEIAAMLEKMGGTEAGVLYTVPVPTPVGG